MLITLGHQNEAISRTQRADVDKALHLSRRVVNRLPTLT